MFRWAMRERENKMRGSIRGLTISCILPKGNWIQNWSGYKRLGVHLWSSKHAEVSSTRARIRFSPMTREFLTAYAGMCHQINRQINKRFDKSSARTQRWTKFGRFFTDLQPDPKRISPTIWTSTLPERLCGSCFRNQEEENKCKRRINFHAASERISLKPYEVCCSVLVCFFILLQFMTKPGRVIM